MEVFVTDATRVMQHSSPQASLCPGIPEMQLVKVYPHVGYQQIEGFGAALTEAAGQVFSTMEPALRKRFVQLCYGPEGNGYSLARICIQSCDFSLEPHSYMPTRDKSLESFSMEAEERYVRPLVKAVLAENPQVAAIASPWSPPEWAKSNRSMKRGGKLLRRNWGLWARMMARSVAYWRAEGLDVRFTTVQNEPQARQTWESCLFSAAQEYEFATKYLRRALDAEGLQDVGILVWDHNKESMLERALTCFPKAGAAGAAGGFARNSKGLAGLAFHWYSGDHFEALRATRELLGPEATILLSEACCGFSQGRPGDEHQQAELYAHEIVGNLEAGANGFVDWNILLNVQGGPNHVGNFCDAPLMFCAETQQLQVRLPFHYLGHFSRFIEPGAFRVLCTRYTAKLETTCFRNPSGSTALVVLNRTGSQIPFTLQTEEGLRGHRVYQLQAPPHSISTLLW